jgi:hypothetical protein
MPKRSSKPPDDPNLAAFEAVRRLTEEAEEGEMEQEPSAEELRSHAAAILGRLGGKKGGPARARKLSKKRRAEIARKAARARWKRQRGK